MLETRSGTIVRVNSVATKKVAPTKAHILAMVMLASKISKRTIEDRVECDVVRIEAELEENFCDPEIVCGLVEDPIQGCPQLHIA